MAAMESLLLVEVRSSDKTVRLEDDEARLRTADRQGQRILLARE